MLGVDLLLDLPAPFRPAGEHLAVDLIGAQGSAKDQPRRALNRMHTELSLAKRPGFADWTQQRGREARMYDDLRRLQAARHDPADHRTGINLLLACRVAFALHNGDESENTHVSLAAT